MANHSIIVGLLAGCAAGLLMIATVNTGPLAFFLMFIATAAIHISAMGWGRYGAIASVAAATGLIAVASNFPIAMATAMLLFAPAAFVGHLLNFGHREETSGSVSWYPLGAILFRLMLLLCLAFLIVGYMAGLSEAVLAKAFEELFSDFARLQPDLPELNAESLSERSRALAKLVPLVAPGSWLLMHVLTAAIAASITRRSGLLPRGRDDIGATLVLPMEAVGFLVAGLVGLVLLGGIAGAVGSLLLGIGICGYALSGLAMLHYRLRANAAAPVILTVTYVSIILIGFPIVIFTIMGLFRSFQSVGTKPPTNPSNS